MHQAEPEMYALLLICALAFCAPWLAALAERWVRLPSVVVEIALGMVIGRTGLDLFAGDALFGVEFLALIGFCYLMFLSGLELDFTVLGSFRLRGGGHGSLRAALREPFVLAMLSFAGTLVVAALGAWVATASGLLGELPGLAELGSEHELRLTIARGALLALIFSTTSLGVVLQTLKEGRLLGSDYGQTILVAVMAADFGTLFLLTLLDALVGSGGRALISMVIVSTLILLYLVAHWLGYRIHRHPLLAAVHERLAHGTAQIKIRGAFALVMVFVAYSMLVGAEAILGAFLAGALVSLFSPQRESDLRQKLDAIGYGFFVPIFFINVGRQFEAQALTNRAVAALGLLLVLVAVARVLPAQVLRLRFDARRSLAAGWLLTAQLSLTVAALQIGVRLGIIDAGLNAAVLIMAVITCLAGPVLFNRLQRRETETQAARRVIVVGSGEIALFLAGRLARQGFEPVLVDHREGRLEKARRLGLRFVVADPRTVAGLSAAGAEGAHALIGAAGLELLNLEACRLARNVFGLESVTARLQTDTLRAAYQELGVPTVDSTTATCMVLDLLAINPDVLNLATNVEDEHLIREATALNPAICGKLLGEVDLPGDCLILGVHRRGMILVPHGDTLVERLDRLALVGSEEAVLQAVSLLEGREFG